MNMTRFSRGFIAGIILVAVVCAILVPSLCAPDGAVASANDTPGADPIPTSATPLAVLPREMLPDPDFIFNVSSGESPLAVQFTDTSAGAPAAWAWDFDDDGTIDSTERNPVCVYTRPGNYTVNLTAAGAYGVKTILRNGLIRVGSRTPEALYALNRTTGTPPLAVQFTDLSVRSNSTGWAWDFDGDGTIDSMEKNPVCVYTRFGNYTVSLTVTNASGTTTNNSGFVTVTTGMLADFSANVTEGLSPLAVQFSDISTGPDITGWAWDFNNDSVIDSRDQNPACVYTRPGEYTVLLTVFNAFGSDTVAGPGYITATTGTVPDFSINRTMGILPLAVQFTDRSAGPGITGWAWDFDNDGTIDSTERNPVCVYKMAGNYTVNLSVTNDHGTNSTVRQGLILVNSLVPDARFSANTTFGIPPLAVRFTDTSAGADITGWAWDFDNDGTIDSTDRNPVCVYTRPGNYTVNLTVTNGYGSGTTSGTDFIHLSTGEPRARFAVNTTSGDTPLAVGFRDMSDGINITGWSWDFNNDGTADSTERDPFCVYSLPGNYTIRFTVTSAYGSDTVLRKDFIRVA